MVDVTQILSQIEQGDNSTAEELLPLVYDELRKLAAAKLANEKPGQTLQATALVEVLFTLLSERYERRSVLVSSNLPFSKWERIFKDPMTTAAAIDRLVHHSVIIELNKIPSYRLDEAKKKQQKSTASKDGSSS